MGKAATARVSRGSEGAVSGWRDGVAAGLRGLMVVCVAFLAAAMALAPAIAQAAAPTVTSVAPTAGPTGGGRTVVITGSGFSTTDPTGAVKFGATNATYTINSDTQITATSPANSAGTYDVTVTNPDGTSATSAADQYTYLNAPTVTSVSPGAGPIGGGQTVTITGTGFSAANPTLAVRFWATNASYTIDSDTQITAISPAMGLSGTFDITVTTPGGTSAANFDDQYTFVAAPTVTSVSPTAGPTAGGTTVTITGTGFSAAPGAGVGAMAVKFGATNASFTIDSNSQITATSPANSAGTYDITVTTPGGTSATSASDQFTHVAPPVGSSQTYGSIIPYNTGANATTNIDLSLFITGGGTPSSYAVGSATTAQGGSVSVNSSGIATYTPPVGYRNANDSFVYTASNLGGTSSPATVTVTIGNPTIVLSLPSSTATVERVYNNGGAAVTLSGGRSAYTINSISGLPSGLSDAGGGVISGTPTANGIYTVSVNATDSSLGAGPYTFNATATLTVSLPPAPVASSFNISGLTYNSGSASATTFSAAPHSTESPTGYQVGASSYGASVSVDSAGLMSYTPPVGFRGTDVFNYVSTNAGGTSNVGQVFVTVDDPVFSITLPVASGTVGQVYNSGGSVVAVSGGWAPYNNFSATGLPAGLTMDSSGVISGTPTTATNATVVVTVTDSSGGNGSYTSTASASLSIAAPTITLSPSAGALLGAQAGVSYGESITSTGGFLPVTYAVTAGALPPGLSLSAGGVISGEPTATGTYNFSVTATDDSGNSYTGSALYSITVVAPTITVTPSSLPTVTVGDAYSQTFTATGGTAGYTFSLDSGTLPAGLTLAANGQLTGTPTEGGSFPITVLATDSTTGGTYTGAQAYTLSINAPSITLSSAPLTHGAIATAYSETLSASGGTAGYSFLVSAGSLPPGLSLSTGGVISGSPTGAGTYNFTVSATDSSTGSGPYSGAAAYALTVDAPNISLSAGPLAGAAIATAYAETVTASGGVTPYSYAVTAGSLPPGLTLSTGGAISGTPTGGGTYNFTISATDSATGANAPFTGSAAYAITVGAPTITLSPSTLTDVTVGTTVSQAFTAGGGTGAYTYAVTAGALPAGVTLSPAGQLSGAPTAGGAFNFTITATDSSGGQGPYTGSAAYAWTIGAPTITLTAGLSGGQVGAAYAETVTASGGVGPYTYAITAGALPAGLALAGDGAISGTPTVAGTFNVTITARDSATGTGAPYQGGQPYALTIASPALTLTPSSLTGMTAGQAYAAAVTASGGTAPYSYALHGGTTLPAGLTLSSTGEITGTPTATGPFSFTIAATDSSTGVGAPFTVARAYNVTVAASSVSLAAPALPDAPYGVAYSRTFAASGGLAPYHYAVTAGALPAGLALDVSTGELSGAPTEAGTFAFTVTATDSATGTGPSSASAQASLVVAQAEVPVVQPITAPAEYGAPTVIDVSSLINGFYDTVVIVDPPSHGTAVVSSSSSIGGAGSSARLRARAPAMMTITYTPNPGYYGADNFTYAATGPGGTSAPAAVSLTIATPAPAPVADTVSTPANAAIEIEVTANDAGPIDTIAIGTAPTHGTVAVNGLKATYTPAENFFGTDTFTYTATGSGGTSGATTVTINVAPLAVPTQTAQVLMAAAGLPATLAATQGATGSPFTSVALTSMPTHGSATASGLNIIYTPTAGYTGSDAFTYLINNPFGASALIPVTVTVNAAPIPAPPITVEILAGQKAVVDLTANANGGPFTGAAVASITPADSGAATIASPSSGRYVLTFAPDNAFAGTAVVTYTLSNAYATSAPGVINVIVTARSDPSQDAEVKGLVAAQNATAVRFADAQIGNFNRRLEQLHNGGGAGRGFGVAIQGGDPYRADGLEARETARRHAGLGIEDDIKPVSNRSMSAAPSFLPKTGGGSGGGGDGQGAPQRWGVWAAGSADFGMRNTIGSQSGFRFTTDGVTAGVDYRVNPQLAVGVGVGYGQDSSRVGKLGTKSRAKGYSVGLYASFQPGERTFVDGLVGVGTLDFDSRRYVTATDGFVEGDRDGDQVFGALTFGMERRKPTSLISPYGRIAYSRSGLNAFSEVGGGPYGLTYHDQTVRSLTGSLGLRGEFSRKVSVGLLSPRFRVEYSHDFEDASDALLSYTDWVGGPIYKMALDPLDSDQLRLELGADLKIHSGLTIGLDFNNSVSKDSDSQGVRVKVQSPF